MKPLWFIFLVLQVSVNLEFSWSQNGKTCETGVLHSHLYVAGMASTCEAIKAGHKLRFLCGAGYELDGSEEIECLPTGQWNASFPSCSEKCIIPNLRETVRITSSVQGNALSKGDKLSFACRQHSHFIQGSPTISCLGNGEWSHPPPLCGEPSGCSAPPALEDGDTKLLIRSNSKYQHGERIEYLCQVKYILEGGPFKTCYNGVWKGDMRCIKPCTVTEELLNEHNVQYFFGSVTKILVPDGNHIMFRCEEGKRLVGTTPMHVQCNDGELNLPTCQ